MINQNLHNCAKINKFDVNLHIFFKIMQILALTLSIFAQSARKIAEANRHVSH